MTDHQKNHLSKFGAHIHNSFWKFTALIPFLTRQQSLSGGGSPEINDSQPTELHGIIMDIADDDDDDRFQGQDLTILSAPELGQATFSPSSPDADDRPPPRRSRGADDMSSSISSESSRLSSSRISETTRSYSFPFTDRGSTSTSTSTSPDLLCLYPETPESSSSNPSGPITSCTLVDQPSTPTPYRPKQITINNSPKISSGNVFRQQELAKHVVGFAMAFTPGVMILHHSSPKTMTWRMTVTVILLLSVGVAALWNSNLVQDKYPVCAHRIQMLGFALAMAAFWGLISFFLWNSYAIVIPIACWAVSGVILALKAYKFKDPGRDF